MHRRQAADISVLARQKGGSTHTNRSTNASYYNRTIDKQDQGLNFECNSQPQSGFVFSTPALFVEGE